MNRGKLFVLSAPSGSGKTTVLKEAMRHLQGVAFSVSHTTRPPRQGEKDGVDYHFVDASTFVAMREKQLFLEWAEVHGNLYGTSQTAVEQQVHKGWDVILDIDVQGASIIRRNCQIEAAFIFLAPPNLAELERRLRSRGLDDDATIATRLANAEKELAVHSDFDYLIVNETVGEAVRMFEAIILAERARNRRDLAGNALMLGASL